ncbi:MAG: S49 family peptidase, partial [Desulfomonilia bacterium]
TEAERRYFEEMARDVHEQFKDAVAVSRGMTRQEVDGYADGRALTGRQALSAGLIDKLGGLDRVIEDARQRAGIEGKPRIVWRQPSEGMLESLRHLIGSFSPAGFSDAALRRQPVSCRFEYSIQ